MINIQEFLYPIAKCDDLLSFGFLTIWKKNWKRTPTVHILSKFSTYRSKKWWNKEKDFARRFDKMKTLEWSFICSPRSKHQPQNSTRQQTTVSGTGWEKTAPVCLERCRPRPRRRPRRRRLGNRPSSCPWSEESIPRRRHAGRLKMQRLTWLAGELTGILGATPLSSSQPGANQRKHRSHFTARLMTGEDLSCCYRFSCISLWNIL